MVDSTRPGNIPFYFRKHMRAIQINFCCLKEKKLRQNNMLAYIIRKHEFEYKVGQ